eukprot:jgi/Chlat1/4711/Chrsp30S04755
MSLEAGATESLVRGWWEASVVPALQEFIAIPNQSPFFDKEWANNGHQDKVVDLFVSWAKTNAPFAQVDVVRAEGRTPVIFLEVPASSGSANSNGHAGSNSNYTVLMYGHADKQPPLLPWAEGLGPWTPVIKDGKLYGRGGADDGYAMFAALTAIKALKEQGVGHPRIVILIEFCEESGSPDLPFYVDMLSERIGDVRFVVCLDSGAGNYEQLWVTTSLRGIAAGNLKVQILKEGVHSGLASGIVPSSFAIVRQLLDRLDDSTTSYVTEEAAKFLTCGIPPQRLSQAKGAAEELGVYSFPWVEGAHPLSSLSPEELLLRRTWKPAVSITGAEGFPTLGSAGNVLRPYSAFKLSVRLPPAIDGETATKGLKALLERDPPYGAKVEFEAEKAASGWDAPPLEAWLEQSTEQASQMFYAKPARYIGEGGSIPFMGMLGAKYPKAQFLVTGVLGPNSNAHGPNEFIHLDFAMRLTCCVAHIVADYHQHVSSK